MAEPSNIWGLDALLTEVPITVPGTYQLILRVPATRLSVGALGAWDIDAGVYVYTGSAVNGVRQRVLRHLRPGARVRWHIDYLRSVGTAIEPRTMPFPFQTLVSRAFLSIAMFTAFRTSGLSNVGIVTFSVM